MSYLRYFPSAPLSAYVEDLYYLDGPAPYPHQKVMPVASSNLMINLGDLFDVYRPGQTDPFITCTDSWWVGIWDTYHTVDWPPSVRLFGVHFKPGGAYPFLQIPLSEMNGQVVPLDAIWGAHAGEIRESLDAAPTIQAGFALFEQWLLRHLCSAPRGLDLVQCAVAEIARMHGTLPIQRLSDQLGVSQNYLGVQSKRLVGISPKRVARFFRFAHALQLIDAVPHVDFTALAHQAQFYDQAHFNKEFVSFTGHSPSEYVSLRRRVQRENPEHAHAYRNLPID